MSEKIDTPKYPNGVYPELSPNPDFHNGLEDRTSETANTQVVNEPKVQSPKDFDLDDIIALIQKYAPGFDPSSVEAGTLISALGLDANNLLKKQALAGMFDGKYVRIMNAPSSTTLNDEQIEVIKEGVFIDGEFLGFHNPVLFPPASAILDFHRGIIMGQKSGVATIQTYQIRNTKVIELFDQFLFDILNLRQLNGKTIPTYPSDTGTFTLKCVDGVLTWVAD